MKRDFSIILKDLDGNPLRLEDGETPANLGIVSIRALMAPKTDSEGRPTPATGEEALRAFDLALRIRHAKEPIEVSSEDVAYIKGRIEKFFTAPLWTATAWRAIEYTPTTTE